MKKFLSIMLSILMVVTMIPMAVLPASAAENLDYNITVEVVDWAVYETSGELIGEFNAVEHGDAFYDVSLTQADDGTFTFSYQIALERNGGNTAWDESSISFRIDSCEDEFMQEFEKSCYSNYNIFYNLKVTRRAGHSFSDWTDAGDGTHTSTCNINSAHKVTASHNYAAATCSVPEICKYCGATQGEELGHDIVAATFGKPAACSRCGATDINISVLEAALINTNVNLPSKAVKDDNSGYNDITWSVVDAGSTGATINGNTLKALYPGEAIIRATIESGSKDFTVRFIKSENIDISLGSVVVSQKDDSTLTVTYAGFEGGSKDYIVGEPIQITGTTTSNYVEVSSGAATIILNDVSISRNGYCFRVNGGATADLTLVGSNAMSTGSTYAALSVPENATVIIGGEGTLTATSSKESAAIGSGYSDNGTGTIVINGGTIIAENTYSSGSAGAGIGGGNQKNGGNITINGGVVTANGGRYAAGIGGGNYENGGNITINGGIVTATGGESAAGIGGGLDGDGGQITITGGTVIAKGGDYRQFYSGAGIGGGYDGNGGTVVITGGNIEVIAGSSKAEAIGKGGNGESSGTLKNASGNDVTLRTITLSGAAADTPVTKVEGITYGLTDVKTCNTDKLYFYLPADAVITSITAGGNEYICNSNLTYYTAHSWVNNDGICDTCGYECPHESYTDGVCDNCGYECAHENETGDICSVCGGHCGECTYTDNGDGTHSFTCTICHITGTENHTGGTATCKEQAKCEHCGASYGELDPNNHEYEMNNGICCDTYQPATLVTNENYESFYLKADYVGYYVISNAGQLFWYANYINTVDRTANAVLTADIDLENRPWTPIGSTGENSNNFRGIFDGQNYIIRGLYVEGDSAGLGFFGEVRTGTVKNFTIYGEVVVNTEVDYVGGVIGSICGVNGENDLERNGAIIQNIKSFVNLTVKAHGVGKIGGFVGYANHQSLIEKCSWYGTFDAGEYRVDNGAGGFIGRIQENSSEVTIRNCGAYGTIKTNYAGDYNNTATIYMGGFLSFSNTNAKTTLENCLFAGRFKRGENLTDEAFLGAFGTLRSVKAIKNCYYLGDDGLEAVHSDSPLKPGNDNVEITKATGEELKKGTVAKELGEYWEQGVHYPTLKDHGSHWGSETYGYTDNGDGTHDMVCTGCGHVEVYNEAHGGGTATCTEQANCKHCGASYGELDPDNHASDTYIYTDNGDGTHTKTHECGVVVVESEAHTIENHVCTGCGAMEIVVSFNAGDYEWKTGDQINFVREVEGICIDDCVFTATVAEDGTVTWTADKPFCWYGEGEQKLFAAPNNGWAVDYFVIPEDQSTSAKLDEADLVNGMWVGTPTTDTVTFNMTHRMAKVTVNYEFAEGVTADISELKVYSIAQICRFSTDDWSIKLTSAGQYDVWVTPYLDGNQFTAFIIPETYATDEDFIKITLDNGTVYEVKMNKAVTFAEGAEYTYKVIITAVGAYLTCADECSFEYIANEDGLTHSKVCTECGYVAASENHTLTYTAKDNVITAACSANCGYSETATISAEDTTYNGTEQKTATVTYSDGWKSDELTISYENNVNAGPATASITVGEVIASVDFTIAKAPLTVTASDATITYGEAPTNNGVTYSGFVNGENENVLGGELNYSYTYTQNGNVGDYSITPEGLTADNYEITFVDGTLTVEQIDINDIIDEMKINLEQYSYVYDGTEKKPKVISVTVDGVTLTEGTDYTVRYEDNVYVGNYATAVINFEGNYDGTFRKWFTITKAYYNLTAPTPNTLTYNGEDQYLVSAGTVEGADFEYSLDGTSWSTSIPQAKDVGNYTVYYRVRADENHYDVKGTVDVTINECAHTWDEGVLTRPVYDAVLGSKDGYYTYTCTLCGEEKTEAVKSADYSAYEAVSEEINALLQSDDLTSEAKQAIYSAANECGHLSDDLTESEQNIVDDLVAELEKIVADAEEKIASGEYVKADYTEIDEVIASVDEALENSTISEEMANELSDIKSQLEALKENENTSMADAAELLERVKAVAETMADCANGIHSFTKYEVTEEAECGKAGKEVASCDHGCGATDENEIPALTHKDEDGDLKCDHGCGHEFEQPVEPEQPDTPDEPEQPEEDGTICEYCGSNHNNPITRIFCRITQFFIRLFTFLGYWE